MTLNNLLTRCDIDVFQGFLGQPCTKLLELLDPTMSSPAFLRRLVEDSIGPYGLLLNPAMRTQLLMLLRKDEAERLCTVLKIAYQDNPFLALSGASIARGSNREISLFDFFELPPPPVESIDYVPDVTITGGSYPLFSHQRKASRKALNQIKSPPYRVMLHMPTGSGKTRTAMHIICDYLRSTEPTVVVWLAYNEELCDQASEEFEKAWLSLGDRPVSLRRFWGKHNLDISDFKDGILIAGLPKMVRLAANNFGSIGDIGARTSFVVLDEAHQAVAREYKHVLEALLAHHSNSAILGLSATPGRTWNEVEADEELAIFFSRRKVGLEIDGYANPVDYLVQEGYLAKANFHSLFYNPGFTLGPDDLQKLRASLDVPDTILRRLGEDEMRNLAILNKVEELAKRHKRIIVFASSVKHSSLIANVLRARGLDSNSITTETTPPVRARTIDLFRSDSPGVMILCNYGVLTTGFDAPQTSCAVIARPTKSLILYSQMVGRAIRGLAVGGNLEAEIITVIDQQLPGFGSVADAFANWEDIWTVPVN